MTGGFEPKTTVQLNPPKDDPITKEHLSKCNGTNGKPCYVAIKGKVFDVTGKDAYLPGGSYSGALYSNTSHKPRSSTAAKQQNLAFAGHDASRALGKTSTKTEDVSPDWSDLPDNEKKVLDDWITFFTKRYNIVGVVEGATNL